MKLSERMVLYRAKHDLSQGELAERCNLSKMTVNAIENGLQEPSKLTLAKIELVIGKETDEDVSVDIKTESV